MLGKLKGSIFYRIIFIFVLFMIPLYILGMMLYLLSTSLLQSEISKNMSSQMDFYLDYMDDEIMRIRTMQIEFMNDEDLNYLANANSIMWDFEKTLTEQRVERRLLLFKYNSDYIQKAEVHIPSMGNTISSEEGLIDLSPDYTYALEQIDGHGGWALQITPDGWFLYSAYPLRLSYEIEPIYIVVSQISRSSIDEFFSTLISTFGGTFAHVPDTDIQFGLLNENLNNSIIQAFKDNQKPSQVVNIPGEGNWLVLRKQSDYLNIDYYGYASEDEVFAPARRIALIFFIFTIAVFAIVILFTIFSSRTVHQPVARLVKAFEHLEKGDLDVRIDAKSEDEFRYLYDAFNSMVGSLKNLFTKVTNYEVLTREAQLKQLQAQISPHFLYNCLYIIYRLAQMGDMENVVLFTKHLNTYYRYITRDAKNEVPLIEEIDHARNYTSIQQIRFSNRLSIHWGELPEKYKNLIVPRLILQPVIENAFQYGLKDMEENGLLEIDFEDQQDGLLISIENNGPVPDEEAMLSLKNRIFSEEYQGETTALRNIHRRLSSLFGEGSGLDPLINAEGHFCLRLILRKDKNA
jgi:two-component system sensor histidine kinase YesM